MLYRHTPAFQLLLHKALHLAAQERDFSDQKMVAWAKLECGKSTLNRFRTSFLEDSVKKLGGEKVNRPIGRIAGAYLNAQDAELLWSYLDAPNRRLIEQVIAREEGFKKASLFPLREVANAMHGFFGVEKESTRRLVHAGVSGSFFCYKPSFRKEGFAVKSRMILTEIDDDYYEVREKQRTSGRYEIDGIGLMEESSGFGLVKSDRLWLFLQDVETEQPRIFCLIPKFGRVNDDLKSVSARSQVASMHGYLIEGVSGNRNDAFGFNVVMIREDVEKERWTEQHTGSGKAFDPESLIDIYPTGDEQRKKYANIEGIPNAVPDDIAAYLKHGLHTEA